ncbi:PI206-like protein [Hibiscus syriacus]|uniref:Dirigent protein n=1 Tax=Hibiscus syriacus TaxID=106335 RepID=A0A6A3B2P5_HIBSY|nr:PI206-like protein [Hibiscus syriacus]
MARLFIFFLFTISIASALAEDDSFVRAADRKFLGLNKKEKLSHFKLYWHDILGGRNPTAVPVVMPSKNSSTAFGMISVIDDPLTMGPEMSSKMVGRAQGEIQWEHYNDTGEEHCVLQIEGDAGDRGSGLFRFARGYVQAKTHRFDPATGDAVVEYNCYVMHY